MKIRYILLVLIVSFIRVPLSQADDNTAFFDIENSELVFPELALPDGEFMHQVIFKFEANQLKYLSEYSTDDEVDTELTTETSFVSSNYKQITVPRVDFLIGDNSLAYTAILEVESLSPRICLKIKSLTLLSAKVLVGGTGMSNNEGADYVIQDDSYVMFYIDKFEVHIEQQIQNMDVNYGPGFLDFLVSFGNDSSTDERIGTLLAFDDPDKKAQHEPVSDVAWQIGFAQNFPYSLSIQGSHNTGIYKQSFEHEIIFHLRPENALDQTFTRLVQVGLKYEF